MNGEHLSKTETKHIISIGQAQKMDKIKDNSVNLIVTSPPYPMIEMWDDIMAKQNPEIKTALNNNKGAMAFELMHKELDKVWAEINRVLIPGGFACINIGDATRTINGEFSLFSNHSRIISSFISLGLSNLPNIIWRKQTNAPNKFMGSGMLPSGAYVTLEHEWILIFRKGGKRIIKNEEEKLLRKKSAFFWEERNIWFSDLWELKGTKQKMNSSETRQRSAAYPYELPYRLINMYSMKGDIVLDPFLGTGTTTIAAMASERNSMGIEIDNAFLSIISDNISNTPPSQLNELIKSRLEQHENFVRERAKDPKKKDILHFNANLNLPVITSQETGIELSYVKSIKKGIGNQFIASYTKDYKSNKGAKKEIQILIEL